MAKERQVIGFRVGRETFAAPIETVQEILRPMPITPVPGAPAHVEGVINLRGRIVSVLDLRKQCGAESAGDCRKNRIVVTQAGGRHVGLVVDAASEVLRIADACIEPPSTVFGDSEPGFITGVAKLPNRLVMLVDMEKLVQGGMASLPAEVRG